MKKPNKLFQNQKHNQQLSSDTIANQQKKDYPIKPNQTNPLAPVILIFIGTIFLLNNFGILPWSIWDSLWKLWPLLLILWGVYLLLGKSPFANLLVTLLG